MAAETNAEALREFFLSLPPSVYVLLGASTFLIILVMTVVCLFRRKRKKEAEAQSEAERFIGPKPRFRKRDKMIFYGKKMLRKVKQFSQPREEGYRKKIRKRQKVMFNFAKQFLHFGDSEPERQLKEPPPAFLEADVAEIEQQEPRLPPEVFYMFKSVRVFGHFEKPLFFELCKFIETMSVPANALVFHPGQVDDSIYVVQSGKLGVFLIEKDGSELPMKEVETGESVYSVLTILDTLTGHNVKLPQVFCRALVDTEILKLPGKAFQTVFEQHPDSMVRVVQMIMLRLQQVTFMALHNFLGLSYELIESGGGRRMSVQSATGLPGSPSKTIVEGVPASKESVRKPAIKKLCLDLGEADGANESTKPTPDSAAVSGKTDEKEGSESLPQAATSKPVPIKKKLLTRSVSFTEPDHAPEVKLGRCKSMPYMYGLTLLDPFDQSEDTLGSTRSPSDFDAVCSRARVPSAPDSPTSKATFDLGSKSPDQSDHEELNIGSPESRFDFPPYPVSQDIAKKFLTIDPSTEDELLKTATKEIAKFFQLPDEHILDGMLNIASIPAGTVLMKQGDQECNLHFVMKGTLTVKQTSAYDEKEHTLYAAHAGEFVGVLAVMTGEPSFFTVEATNKCYVAIISKGNFYSIIRQKPRVVLYAAHSLIKHLSPFLRQIDFALDWMHLEAGQALYSVLRLINRQGEPSGCIYIVLNGRLRSVVTLNDGKKELVSESGRGEIVGVVEVLTQAPRATTVHAIRDTELAVLPDGLLNTIKRNFPQVVTRLIRLLGERLLGHYRRGTAPRSDTLLENHLPVDNQIFGGSNLGTVVVIPVSSDVPLANFAFELSMALNSVGPTLLLNSALVRQRLGSSALESVNDFRMVSWLGQQEDLHRIVLYQADSFMSAWTKRCIRRADCILIVGIGDQSPTVGELERQLEAIQVRSQKELILLHRDQENLNISGTVEWLNARGWISAHHHVRCSKKIFSRRLISDRYERNPAGYQYPARNSDFSRLARRLTGTSIGLVLGGGGARGLSHVGVIKALYEAGIPIDMVGGTSMGSFVGAAYAEDACIPRMCQRVREWSWDMTSIFKQILDLTYPFTSMFSGNGFNASVRSTFGEKQIEDMLLPYFCITTDITSSRMRVHTDGSLWRYIRASMSLSGYLPPLCDPKDGHLLLDGGYVNNLPADVMKTVGAQTIIAIDVGSEYSDSLVNYGDQLSGWWLLWNKWNPFAESLKIPDMAEVQTRLAYVSCVQQLAEVKESSYCEYIRPPIDRFKTLEFGRFSEIVDVGYQHGRALFKEWIKGRHMPDIFREHPSRSHMYVTQTSTTDKSSRPHTHRSGPSFTDLAEKISRIEPPINRKDFTQSLSSSAPASTYDFLDGEDEDEFDDDRPLRYRPRTGSLSEHEDLLAFKAEAEAAEHDHVHGMHGYTRSFSADEAGYDSDDITVRRRIGDLVRASTTTGDKQTKTAFDM